MMMPFAIGAMLLELWLLQKLLVPRREATPASGAPPRVLFMLPGVVAYLAREVVELDSRPSGPSRGAI